MSFEALKNKKKFSLDQKRAIGDKAIELRTGGKGEEGDFAFLSV